MAQERDIIDSYYEIVQSFADLYRNLSLYYINQMYSGSHYRKYRNVVEQYINYQPADDHQQPVKSPFLWPHGE